MGEEGEIDLEREKERLMNQLLVGALVTIRTD